MCQTRQNKCLGIPKQSHRLLRCTILVKEKSCQTRQFAWSFNKFAHVRDQPGASFCNSAVALRSLSHSIRPGIGFS